MTRNMTSRPSKKRFFALLLVGFGLIAIGAMLILLFDAPAASTRDFATVPAEVNFPAPELNLTNLDGEPVSLADYKGDVILVNLWATWCPPCREEMPTLRNFYEKYKSAGFTLIAIDQGETAQQVLPFANNFGLTFPIWLDGESEASRAFKTMSLPSSYVIDRQGQVRLMWIGGISERNLEKYLPDIIRENK